MKGLNKNSIFASREDGKGKVCDTSCSRIVVVSFISLISDEQSFDTRYHRNEMKGMSPLFHVIPFHY